MATLLPAVEFSTRSPYPDARRLLDAGAVVALATDCNPGSCYSSSMPLCIALAVREMRLTPAEALWSATAGGADCVAPQRHRPSLAGGAGRPDGAGRAEPTCIWPTDPAYRSPRRCRPRAGALPEPGRGERRLRPGVLELGRQVPGRAAVVVGRLPGREQPGHGQRRARGATAQPMASPQLLSGCSGAVRRVVPGAACQIAATALRADDVRPRCAPPVLMTLYGTLTRRAYGPCARGDARLTSARV